jgi:hypothetical protein
MKINDPTRPERSRGLRAASLAAAILASSLALLIAEPAHADPQVNYERCWAGPGGGCTTPWTSPANNTIWYEIGSGVGGCRFRVWDIDLKVLVREGRSHWSGYTYGEVRGLTNRYTLELYDCVLNGVGHIGPGEAW